MFGKIPEWVDQWSKSGIFNWILRGVVLLAVVLLILAVLRVADKTKTFVNDMKRFDWNYSAYNSLYLYPNRLLLNGSINRTEYELLQNGSWNLSELEKHKKHKNGSYISDTMN